MSKPRYVTAWGPARLSDGRNDELERVLTSGERARASVLSPERASRYMAGRSLVRELAARQLQRTWESTIPQATCSECGGDHGAITIRGSELNVSVAYSGDHAVAFATQGRKVGIDIESGHPSEERQVGVLHSTTSITLQSWCDYEAVIKADGRGIQIDFSDVEISERDGEKYGQVRGSAEIYAFIPLEAPAGVVVSAVIETLPG